SDYRLPHENVGRVSINTADAFQGNERELILFSAVQSNRDGDIRLTRDSRSVNEFRSVRE
ncbi:hypothetical protein Pmar_PMAR021578, partial [Perkinsus marinus ATCC 50983]